MQQAAEAVKEKGANGMAGDLHDISVAIGALQEGMKNIVENQKTFEINLYARLSEKDRAEETAFKAMKSKVDSMHKAYTMGSGVFWLIAFGGMVVGFIELVEKARAALHS